MSDKTSELDDDVRYNRELVAKNLALALERKDETQAWLIRTSGVSKRMVIYIMNAQKSPTLDSLTQLARALDIEVRDLFEP